MICPAGTSVNTINLPATVSWRYTSTATALSLAASGRRSCRSIDLRREQGSADLSPQTPRARSIRPGLFFCALRSARPKVFGSAPFDLRSRRLQVRRPRNTPSVLSTEGVFGSTRPVLKTGVPARVPRVRIPVSPLFAARAATVVSAVAVRRFSHGENAHEPRRGKSADRSA